MKRLYSFVIGSAVILALFACGGGSSGGGSGDLNLSGTWRIFPNVSTPGVTVQPINVTFNQNGPNVTSSSFQSDPTPPNLVDCGDNDNLTTVTGAVSGNTFNGVVNSNVSTTSFSLTGTNTSLSGNFTLNVFSGVCAGTYQGTLTMTRV